MAEITSSEAAAAARKKFEEEQRAEADKKKAIQSKAERLKAGLFYSIFGALEQSKSILENVFTLFLSVSDFSCYKICLPSGQTEKASRRRRPCTRSRAYQSCQVNERGSNGPSTNSIYQPRRG